MMFEPTEEITLYHRTASVNGAPVYEESTARASVIEAAGAGEGGVTAAGSVFIIAPPADAAIGDAIGWGGNRYRIGTVCHCRDLSGRICGIRCTAIK